MGTRPLAEYDSAWEYLLLDGLGSVRQLVDSGGNVKLTKSYEPYGSVLTSQGSATSAFGFTGEQFDASAQLVFLRARYYAPAQGRFATRDTWEGDYNAPLTLNRWNYVNGNPINKADPTGKCEDNGDEECWGVYEQIVRLCPECAVTMSWPPGTGDQPLYKANIRYLERVLRRLHNSVNPDREELAQQNAELLERVLPVVKDQAAQFGVPWQIAAGILDTERQLDWSRDNEYREWAYKVFGTLAVLAARSQLSGGNPGAGIANIHADTARTVAKYFEADQCVHWKLPVSSTDENLDVVNALAWYENNSIRMMTAYVRQLADFRFGSNGRPLQTSHANLTDWTLADAVAIWHGYRYGVPGISPEGQAKGFRVIEYFQDRTISLDQLIGQIVTGDGRPQQSARESVPIFEKYFRMR